jgi:DNA-binding transcriptional regulator YhcF (GntR family)
MKAQVFFTFADNSEFNIAVFAELLSHGFNPAAKNFGFFAELDRNGIIVSGQGRGCFVADGAADKIRARLFAKIAEIEDIASALAQAGIEKEKVMEAVLRAYEKKF